jgi:DNA-binding MarR family transcriptional regulator
MHMTIIPAKSDILEMEADLQRKHSGRAANNPTGKDRRPVAASTSNPLEKVIGYRLRRAQLVTFQEFIDFFARVKLRPAEYALIAVLEHQPGLSQTNAAKMLGIKRANFVSLLDALERRGLAERRVVHGDRRSRALHLTNKGRQLATKAEAIAAAYDDMLVERLGGAAERDRFLAMLDRLTTKD